MTSAKLRRGTEPWSNITTTKTSTANTLSTFASKTPTGSASLSSTLSGVASTYIIINLMVNSDSPPPVSYNSDKWPIHPS